MTRYELKDKEKQAKYLAAFPDFLEALRYGIQEQIDPNWITVASGVLMYKITLHASEIQTIPEYDPNAWNEYPTIKPPVGVPMRIEYKTCKGHIGGILALFFDGTWHRCTPDGTTCFLILDRDVKRFRPWDDDNVKPTEWVAPCKSL